MIYIDIPEEIRLERVLDRDGYIGDREQIRAKYENRYFSAERYYTEMCSPAEKAGGFYGDFVIGSIESIFAEWLIKRR